MSIIEIAYDKALEGEEFNKIDVSQFHPKLFLYVPRRYLIGLMME